MRHTEKESSVFAGISSEEKLRIMECLDGKEKEYPCGSVIRRQVTKDRIAFVSRGSIEISELRLDGIRNLLGIIEKDMLILPDFSWVKANTAQEISVRSTDEGCSLIFFDLNKATGWCEKCCRAHKRFARNLLTCLANRNNYLTERIELLSQRKTRDKLIAYLGMESRKQHTKDLVLPLTMKALADYLCVDRTAMLREMKKLREEGLIEGMSGHIRLKGKPFSNLCAPKK
ncbi:Crp/Fnr family transcriptional regulator [Anaerovorax odorimutans]|uniref:Crp/Fnr family transcriptional regulator n=1 Tax=Anaerovorax odorimutans TaxID=109327 RepID=A0ABT1RT71_9FIRM|nr:Crp/Fnr family transcriptional regulator [Anaerovorax odorimutans]MCQ4638341.1 Crp/Fnr family transcriptional regulator [Anaerovorax odorimutans]